MNPCLDYTVCDIVFVVISTVVDRAVPVWNAVESTMMASVAETDYEQTLQTGTRRAQILLDKLQLSEAQSAYHEVLRLTSKVSAGGHGTCRQSLAAERATVVAVSGLAESFARQSRFHLSSAGDDDQRLSVSWLRLNIQVFAYKCLSSSFGLCFITLFLLYLFI